MSYDNYNIKPDEKFYQKLGINSLLMNAIYLNSRHKKIMISCRVKSLKCLEEQDILYLALQNSFDNQLEVAFKTNSENLILNEEEIKKIVLMAITRLKLKSATPRSFLTYFKINPIEKDINIELNNEKAVEILNSMEINVKLEKILYEYGLHNYKVYFYTGDLTMQLQHSTRVNTHTEEYEKAMQEARLENKNKVKTTTSNNEYKGGYRRTNVHKEIKGDATQLKNFEEIYEGDNCIVEGKIFYSELRDLKEGRKLYILKISDNTDSVTVKRFLRSGEELKLAKETI